MIRIPAGSALALLALSGCRGALTEADPTPEIVSATIVADPGSVLRATVRVETRFVDSVAVGFLAPGMAVESRTPAVAVSGDTARVPVLGLFGATRHTLRVVAWGEGRSIRREGLELMTGPLPDDLPSFTAGGSDPFPGFVAFQAGMYGLVIDNSGRVVWYHRFALAPGLNFQPQPNGRYVARPTTTAAAPQWVEIDPMGVVTRNFGCGRGLAPRFHDVIVEPDGDYWTMCDDVRVMDLTPLGGRANAVVIGTAVQYITAAGVQFEWTPFDHLDIADLDPAERAGVNVNWTHGNALALDRDGHLLLSLRNLSEVVKIDTRTGALLWQMGGVRNQFGFLNGTAPAFLRQHGLRMTGPGTFVLLDNLGDPASRVEQYAFDEGPKSVRLLQAFATADGVIGQQGGTTQLLPEGRILAAYGNGNRVEEYDANGKVVWAIFGNPGFVYRAERIKSLYHPGLPLTR